MKKILFIRRDNIGDLVLTTPAIYAVREKLSDAKIGVLVNSYNMEAIENNPDVDEVYVYEKAKHVPGKSKFMVWWNNFKLLRKIRRERYDISIGCGLYSPTLARYTYLTGASVRIGYVARDGVHKGLYNKPLLMPEKPVHEVERTFNLLEPLGIEGPPPSLQLLPNTEEVEKAKAYLQGQLHQKSSPIVAFQISSRMPANRWPPARFIELGQRILNHSNAQIFLFWSPGSKENVLHPGDDEHAAHILHNLIPPPVAFVTTRLRQLIAALSLVDIVVTGDGGAMHIAAALGKPIVAVWGEDDSTIWKPWKARHILLTDPTKKAENIPVERVFDSVRQLLAEV